MLPLMHVKRAIRYPVSLRQKSTKEMVIHTAYIVLLAFMSTGM